MAYCPRLFYLEEVEELYTQDAAVFAGRRLHAELEKQEGEEWEDLYLESKELGLRGRVDALRTREGQTIPYEHKRGRSHRNQQKQSQAWESDQLQILAYCYLIESALEITVQEGRIRYHADNCRSQQSDHLRPAIRTLLSQDYLQLEMGVEPGLTATGTELTATSQQ
jgi:CRISPR-associated protein Cas1